MARAIMSHYWDPPTDGAVVDALLAYDDERLVKLLALRPDLAVPPPGDLRALASRAVSPSSVAAAWHALDRRCQQIIEALCVLASPRTPKRLAALIGPATDPESLGDPLDRLVELALLDIDGSDQLTLNPAFDGLPFPADLGPPATVLLQHVLAPQLNAMAARLGVKSSKTKAATIEVVAGTLADADRILRLLGSAPPGTTELANCLAHEHPTLTLTTTMYGIDDKTPQGWLANRALVVPTNWSTGVMPAEVGLALRGGIVFPSFELHPPALLSDPARSRISPDEIDGAAAGVALRLVDDVAKVLDDWSGAPPRALKAGGMGVRDVRRAAKLLDLPEPESARVAELAAVAGLVGIDHIRDVVLPLPAYDDWRALDRADRWALLVTAWLGSDIHLSVAGALDQKRKPIPPILVRAAEPSAIARRRLVLKTMAEAEPGEAVEPGSLVRRALWQAPSLWDDGPAAAPTLALWMAAEAEMLGLCAHGALSAAGRHAAVGDLAAAAAALGDHAPRPITTFVLQGDLTAVATGVLAPEVRDELDLIADLESTGAASVHRFSEQSLRRAFDAGRSSEAITGFLEAHATRGVPQALAYMVADLGRRVGQVRIGSTSCYVRGDDPSLLAEVARSKRTAKLGLRAIAPTVLVTEVAPATVLSTLRAAGYLPAEESADGALVVARPEPARAKMEPRLARLANRAAGKGPAFGPCVADDGADQVDSPALAALVRAMRRSPPPPPPKAKSQPSSGYPAPPGDDLFDGFFTGLESLLGPYDDEIADEDLVLYDDDDDIDDDDIDEIHDVARPQAIARGPDVVRLLAQACDEEWMVRLSYTNGKGGASELTVAPIELSATEVLVQQMPRWDTKALKIDRVHWARVLTSAEERHYL